MLLAHLLGSLPLLVIPEDPMGGLRGVNCNLQRREDDDVLVQIWRGWQRPVLVHVCDERVDDWSVD